jgi:hypothetical protein
VIILVGLPIADLKLGFPHLTQLFGGAMRLKGKKNKKMNDGCISTREAGKILGIGMSSVSRYFDRGILTGEHHPITHSRRINKESVIALMKKYGMKLGGEIELQGNSDSRERTDTSGQGAENDTKKLSPHCG